jgi:hypothetical protein
MTASAAALAASVWLGSRRDTGKKPLSLAKYTVTMEALAQGNHPPAISCAVAADGQVRIQRPVRRSEAMTTARVFTGFRFFPTCLAMASELTPGPIHSHPPRHADASRPSDVRDGLQTMRDAGLRLVTLTNSAPGAV